MVDKDSCLFIAGKTDDGVLRFSQKRNEILRFNDYDSAASFLSTVVIDNARSIRIIQAKMLYCEDTNTERLEAMGKEIYL